MENNSNLKKEFVRVGKYLNEIVSIKDAAGNLLHKAVKPVMLEFYPRDIFQIIVGATLLSVPVSFTEEVWILGQELPVDRIMMMSLFSLVFVGLFIFYNSYREHFREHKFEFLKRLMATYIISLLVALLILFLINKAPMGADWLVTFKRMVIIAIPASMSAAVADMIK